MANMTTTATESNKRIEDLITRFGQAINAVEGLTHAELLTAAAELSAACAESALKAQREATKCPKN